jgi:hypothetical protein
VGRVTNGSQGRGENRHGQGLTLAVAARVMPNVPNG